MKGSSNLSEFDFSEKLILAHYGIKNIDKDVAIMIFKLNHMKNRFFEEIVNKNTKNALEVAFISN